MDFFNTLLLYCFITELFSTLRIVVITVCQKKYILILTHVSTLSLWIKTLQLASIRYNTQVLKTLGDSLRFG